MKRHFTLLFAVFALSATITTAQNVPSYVPTSGLVGWWPFNGNANDESGNGNNGTVNGATLTVDRFGNNNAAYSFDGINDYIVSSPTNLPLGNSPRSFSAFIKYEPSIGHSDWSTIISYGTGTGISNPGVLNDFFIGESNYDKIYYSNNQYGSISQASNNLSYSWHHVVTVYDGASLSNISLFLDGVQVPISTTFNYNNITQLFGTLSDLYFGRTSMNYGPNGYAYKGVIDDIGIWNRALNQQEITALYQSQQPQCLPAYVPTNGLVGWWPFCGNAVDESGNGNNGSVNGATLTTDRFGNSNAAYDFNGAGDYISYASGSSPSLNIINDISLSFWVKSSASNNSGIISFGDNVNGNGGYNVAHLSASNPNNISYISNNQPNSWIQSNALFNDDLWNHFVICQKNDTVIVYKNNIQQFIQTGYLSPASYSGSRIIGSGSQLSGFFDGLLDDIGIWSRALTQQEVSSLYNASATSISEITPSSSIAIYPNPTSDILNIKSDAKNVGSIYRIMDATGRIITTGTINSESMNLDMGQYASGMYLFIIGDGGDSFKIFKD